MASTGNIPAELKTIVPYIQRANELKDRDPVMAYWCTYYAAKVGIGLKVRAKDGRAYLMGLMDSLEKMKGQLDDSDALGDIAGQAYIENFALRVFDVADGEDRSGKATKATAKKFSAAACFLEVLNVFDGIEQEFNDKIRYAKWRAGEISKAVREGRTPAPPPGAASPTIELDGMSEDTLVGPAPPASTVAFAQTEVHSPRPSPHGARNVPLPDSPRNNANASNDSIDLLRTPTKLSPHALAPEDRAITPGMWSTAATPGLDDRFAADHDHGRDGSPLDRRTGTSHVGHRPSMLGAHHPEPDEDAWSTASNNPMSRQNSWTVPEYDDGAPSENSSESSGTIAPPLPPPPPPFINAPSAPPAPKHVRFTPSVVGGSEASTSPPQSVIDLPSGSPPSVLNSFPGPPPSASAPPYASAPPVPPHFTPSAPPAPYPNAGTSRTSLAIPEQQQSPAMTPKFVATVQKHCKFAISALDYEDVETARKELRTALAMLGG
ncbi:DUF605-domain-containing protein [Exidia glandulosa HHB12029]|uniref:DUF605-domain-containing protein n=1 Tax=Exidia glandulosa HHB12029 TaxID=1314781 RepID=A0A165PR58_EXIGL|nr:DUF605-domain-containing protein [Exidia glandulosa HHB12029]